MLAPFARASALAIIIAIGALASSVVAAPLTDAAAAPIHAALAALNAGDADAFARAFAPEATIIDEISPFVFAGADAPRTWIARLAGVNKTNGITDEHSTPGSPRNASVEGDEACAVVSERIMYRARGRAVVENGAWTFALRKVSGTWKIVSAAFAPTTP
ncbi:MAG: nuclear transport factor 2 family protein [Vulcanimicrobiaceae bacterium]